MNQPAEITCRVSKQTPLTGEDCFLIEIEAPVLAAAATPGQFVMFRCGQGYDPFLRRPLSIHQLDQETGIVSFLYRVKGKGTEWLSRRSAGDQVSFLGPLGKGFSHPQSAGEGLVVGAGLGVAPLLFLVSKLAECGWKLTILMGGANKSGILRQDAFMEYGQVKIATEDGTMGMQGTVLDLLAEELGNKQSYDRIFSCGPLAVLKGVQQMSKERKIPAELSLEEWMACGVGACMGCVCSGADGSFFRVCHEGPVFEAKEVLLGG